MFDQMVRYVDWDASRTRFICMSLGWAWALMLCAYGEAYALWKSGELR
jgi:hypothetical protein